MNKSFLTINLSVLLAMSLTLPEAQASEKDLYKFLWLDPDKSVYVLQNKVYRKKKSIYADFGYLKGLSSNFQDTKGFSLSAGYYFTEELALEVMYNSYSNKDNDAYTNLQAINQSVPFVRRLNSNMAVIALWSPFYGKINTFNKIYYFDWSFGAGVGKLDAESNATTVSNPTQAANFQEESYTSFIGKTKLKFHINKNFHLGLEYINTTYKAPGPQITGQATEDKYRSNSDLIFSIGFSF